MYPPPNRAPHRPPHVWPTSSQPTHMAPTPLASIRAFCGRLRPRTQRCNTIEQPRAIVAATHVHDPPARPSPTIAPTATLTSNAASKRDSPSDVAATLAGRVQTTHSSPAGSVRTSLPQRGQLTRDDSVLRVQRMWLLRLEQEHEPTAALVDALAIRRAEVALAAQESEERRLHCERDAARARLRHRKAQLWAESAVLTGMEARLRRRVSCHGACY